jgi:hypothetical protein
MMQVFGCVHTKGNIHFQLQWKGLAVTYKTKNFVLGLKRLYFRITILLVIRVEYLKNVEKIWTLQA